MPVYDMNRCGDLFDRWVDAYNAEQKVINEVVEYRNSEAVDKSMLRGLQEKMFQAHDRSMAIRHELEQFRID